MIVTVDRRLSVEHPVAEGGPITRVVVLNYKSIAACDVALGPLAVIVGRNGAGKSNFVDVLHFTADALHRSVDHALRGRGGFVEVCHRVRSPGYFGIRLDFQLTGACGWYAFTIGGRVDGSYVVQREECRVGSKGSDAEAFFQMEHGRCVATSLASPPITDDDVLYLTRASGAPEFRAVYRALCDMSFYHIDPRILGGFHAPSREYMLASDGNNAAGVLANMKSRTPQILERLTEYLGIFVPEISSVDSIVVGNRRALEFRCGARGSDREERYFADNMSDGTLHVLGVLLALFQNADGTGGAHVVGIEEPETALHPDAAGVLTDVLLDASQRAQVIVTTHSADLLDRESVPVDSILPMVSADGESKIGPLDEAGRSVLREGTLTAGELLRIDQLHPDPELASPQRVDLFRRA